MTSPKIVPFKEAERAEKSRRKAAAAPAASPPPADGGGGDHDHPAAWLVSGECPVVPLGHRDGQYFFFDTAGQLRKFAAKSLGQSSEIVSLFGGNPGWLLGNFVQYDREGHPTNWFSARNAGAWLVRACHDLPLFDRSARKRAVGVWLADGRIVVHCGDHILWPDTREERKAGFRDAGALWPADAPITPPGEACDAGRARQVELHMRSWHWEHEEAARVFFGLWVAGLLGAAIDWRPHGLLIGPPGSGKSTLLRYYAALSPMAVLVNDYSEPGLRREADGRSGPLILDEADEDPEALGRLQRVIGLFRRASSGDGAVVIKTGNDGHAQRFEVISCAVFGSVLPPPLLPQDESRLTRLELRPRPDDSVVRVAPDDLIVWAREHAADLWGRALEGLPRMRGNLRLVRDDLLGRGCEPRLADQLGTIVAARAMMIDDRPLDAARACAEVDAVAWLIVTRQEQAAVAGPYQCLQHLLSSSAEVMNSGERPTLGRLVERGAREAGDDARRQLVDHGLMLAPYPKKAAGPPCLYVANAHPRLEAIFRGTQWAGRRWGFDLARLPGASEPMGPIFFGGQFKPRCIVVPSDALPAFGEGEPPPPDDADAVF
ncbi:P-loop NTPase family protein [Limobrevibacterium gyesilva]|uniref:Uncharacterized protein n=1 Tax=Limobrevibacterium gyesilva TaxID=2991712 RepID=A0AA42CFR2_9PROT|nr:hypothetical protein [Limobrevibacterium gyesilva]MCW3477408.1 hypothetical protein [Limobrevibacterium gyesilva]